MDVDDVVKLIKMQRHFVAPFAPSRYCPRCGTSYPWQDNGPVETTCGACTNDRVAGGSVGPRDEPGRPHCKYCLEEKPLIGVWCEACRDAAHRREIITLLAKPWLSAAERVALNAYQTTQVWKKEFSRG